MLDRCSQFAPFWSRIKVSQTVGSEQPLVPDGNEKLRLDSIQVQDLSPKRLARINHQSGTHRVSASTDPLKINLASIGPMTLRNRDNRCLSINGFLQCISPGHSVSALDVNEPSPILSCQLSPGVYIGGKLLIK